jgi:hypothetical protein
MEASMDEKKTENSLEEHDQEKPVAFSPPRKKAWEEPRLSYVKPKLTIHGSLKELTGFFGGFTP